MAYDLLVFDFFRFLGPDLLGDGMDIFLVEEGIIGWGEFAVGRFRGVFGRPNTGSGRTPTMPEPKTKDFMRLLVQLTKGTARPLRLRRCARLMIQPPAEPSGLTPSAIECQMGSGY